MERRPRGRNPWTGVIVLILAALSIPAIVHFLRDARGAAKAGILIPYVILIVILLIASWGGEG
jgi:hypothetical protein